MGLLVAEARMRRPGFMASWRLRPRTSHVGISKFTFSEFLRNGVDAETDWAETERNLDGVEKSQRPVNSQVTQLSR